LLGVSRLFQITLLSDLEKYSLLLFFQNPINWLLMKKFCISFSLLYSGNCLKQSIAQEKLLV